MRTLAIGPESKGARTGDMGPGIGEKKCELVGISGAKADRFAARPV